MTVRARKLRGTGKCVGCGGRGYIQFKSKGPSNNLKGPKSMPCPYNCQPAKNEYEQFVRDCWAQGGWNMNLNSPPDEAQDSHVTPATDSG
jgi:hypothetical protein